MNRASLCIAAFAGTLSLQAASNTQPVLSSELLEFFDLNCYECHNDVDTEGELDLENLAFDPSSPSNMNRWALIYDRIHHGEMPPKDEFVIEEVEKEAFLHEFEELLHGISEGRTAVIGRVPSRRFTRIEYENTIREILGVDIPLNELLPEDPINSGFDNIAEGQQVSYHLLQKYLEVVDLMLDESFGRAVNPPPVATKPIPKEIRPIEISPFATSKLPTIFFYEGYKAFLPTENKTYLYTNGEFVDTGSDLDLEGVRALNAEISERLANGPYKRVFQANELGVGEGRIHNERQGLVRDGFVYSFPTTHGFHGRMAGTQAPETGWYRIKIRAKASNPPEGRTVWGRVYTGILRAKAPAVFWVGKFEASDEVQEFVYDAWIRKDHIIGVQPIDKTLEWVNSREFPDLSAIDNRTAIATQSLEVERIYPGLETPELRKRLFGKLKIKNGELVSKRPEADLKSLMEQFAERAFRRPVSDYDLQPYVDFAKEELEAKGSLLAAVKAGYRSILSSHRFVYFSEEQNQLDDYAIANRLSYFLWSRPPDETLYAQAKKGVLSQPKVLHAQVERMLSDPKAEAFVKNFADSWLELRDISFTTPDATLYPEFDAILQDSMLDETYAFLGEMLKENLSVRNVIDSDFAMLNERLAHHYSMDAFEGTGVRKIPLDEDDPRGGIITHASVLKVTANGTTTSPIVRGVWLLERILGEHVLPPPDQVPAVEPDIRGAVSIRDQLDKHRSTKECMACHQKIDPPGFALENFDVIGGWRQNYRAINEKSKGWSDGPEVDASYHMPTGEPFDNIQGFKAIALSDAEQIARNVLNQTLTYATGSTIHFSDRREIETILEDLKSEDYGFRSLIHAAVQSDIFLNK